MFSFDTPVSWWGVVSCPGPIVNKFTMGANSVTTTTSNSVTLTLASCSSPTPTPIPPGCKVLLYYNPTDPDDEPITNLVNLLASDGAQMTTIGVTSANYCPTGDNWSNYNQVWDARFISAPQNCPHHQRSGLF